MSWENRNNSFFYYTTNEIRFDFWEGNCIEYIFVFFCPMKKYSLIWIVWLFALILCALGWFYLNKSETTHFFQWSPSLFRFLPSDVDQVLMIDITPDIKEFLRQSNEGFDEASFTAVLESLTQIVIAQAPKWADDVYSAILLAGNEKFSIDQVQALWLLYFDTWYESKQLSENIWLYGDKESISYFSLASNTLSENKEVKQVLEEKKNKQASVFFFSKPWSQLNNDPLTLAFAKKLQYTALYGSPNKTQSKWTMVLQFSWTNFGRAGESFTPQYANQITNNTVLYLEGKTLLQTFWVTDTQFSLGFPLLLAQTLPWIENLLSSNQVSALYDALNKQVSILLQVTDSMFGVGLHLHMATPLAYESLLALQPARRSLASSFVWSWNMREESNADSRSLSIDHPTPGGDPLDSMASGDQVMPAPTTVSTPLITITKNATSTTLSLLPGESDGSQTESDLVYSSDSLVAFRYDANPIMQMAGINPVLGNLVGQMDILWTWAVVGQLNIDSDKQQLILTFETK